MRLLIVFGCLCCFVPRAHAFTIESPIAAGCHERITVQAVTTARWAADVPELAADDAHRRLVGVVPFTVPPEAVADPRVLALLIGVRSPDVDGLSTLDLDRLGSLHGAPGDQIAHCLREAEHNDDAGNAAAITACRAEILRQLDAALGPGDTVDAGTEPVTVSLAFEGPRTIDVPRYEYHLGRALHALQDSFPHTFRDASGMHIVAVHNWIDWVSRHDYDPARDGEHHIASRDACGTDAVGAARVALAEQASTDLLAAMADSTGARAGRLARAAVVLDRWLAVTPGCNATNAFCAAPDAALPAGCSIGGNGVSLMVTVLLTLLFLFLRKSRGRVGALILIPLLLLSIPAAAQERVGSETATQHAHPPRRFALNAAVGGSFDKGGLAFVLGGRYYANKTLSFGLDVEFVPWIDLPPTRVTLGTFDVITSVRWDWARVGSLRFGSRFAAGVSVLLFDPYGASSGDVGPYFGGSLIGLGIDVCDGVAIRIDPEFDVAIPHLTGVPLVYRQYRLMFSLEWRP